MTNKNKLLLGGIILFAWLCYFLAIKNTLELKSNYLVLLGKKQNDANISHQISYLKQEELYLDSILKTNKISIDGSYQNNLLQTIETFSANNQLQITAFKEPHQFSVDEAVEKTYEFTVKGRFNQILKLIYQLEQQSLYGKLIVVDFEKIKNYKSGKIAITCTILIQRIEQLIH